ncbi:isocitrate lyase/phosphoenolpyruvate mutase family protein, partial [Bradyrhizobium sp.]|uniref:isocitrate lyase/phosphoenolpyruvate mutase family protein n=1 Tax=Bradyrhizobium sp. TaxID=376 RepID=UPI00391C3DF9
LSTMRTAASEVTKPLNVVMSAGDPDLTAEQIAATAVKRISVGGALARMAWSGVMKAAKEMAEKGTFTEFANGYPGGELNKMFK